MSDSFPCLVCGCRLDRVDDGNEGQPDDGLMCSTRGNYGSTVFDPEDMSYLAFNICDGCMVRKAELGRVMVTRSFLPVVVGRMEVGRQRCERPYIPWRKGLPGEDAAPIDLTLLGDPTEVDRLPKSVELFAPVDFVKQEIERVLARHTESEER